MKYVDMRLFKVVHTLEDESYLNSHDTNKAVISPFGRFCVVGSKNGNVVFFDLDNGKIEEVHKNEHVSRVVGCEWQKRGSKVATIDSDGNVFVWE